MHNRYKDSQPIPKIYAWAQGIHNARIAIVGNSYFTQLQYPLYGSDLSNYVQAIGVRGPHGDFSPVTTCSSWRHILNVGHYDYVLSSSFVNGGSSERSKELSPPTEWTATDPASRLILDEKTGGTTEYFDFTLFKVTGHLDPSSCR